MKMGLSINNDNEFIHYNYEDYLLDLYYSKLKWEAFQSGFIKAVWNDSIQNQIDALSNLVIGNFDIETHIIASLSYFDNKIQIDIILSSVSACLKGQQNKASRELFTNCLFNRLSLIAYNL